MYVKKRSCVWRERGWKKRNQVYLCIISKVILLLFPYIINFVKEERALTCCHYTLLSYLLVFFFIIIHLQMMPPFISISNVSWSCEIFWQNSWPPLNFLLASRILCEAWCLFMSNKWIKKNHGKSIFHLHSHGM